MMQSRTEKIPGTILLLGLALLLAPPLAAQIDAKGGFVAADAKTGSAEELKEPASSVPRPAPARPGQSGKIAPFGNLMIVQFEEPPLSRYMGDIPGLRATSPEALGTHELDARSGESQAYLGFLMQRQSEHISRIEQALSRPMDVVFRYVAGTHGAAIKMSPAERKVVENLPGIVRVFPDAVEHEHTDAGPPWIGADTIWDGSSTGGQGPTEGEGVIVGILDSGVNSSHDYFAEVGDDGFAHQNPFGDGVFVGWCDPSHPDFDPTFPCNNKMIGAWDYADAFCAANPQTCVEDDGPEDDGGHGSHVASTAIGNVLDLTGDGMRDLSGVAPHANVIIYDIAYIDPVSGNGFAPNSATLAAIDQAILDGVDVLNYSYSGGTSPWTDTVELMFLEAKSAGIFVSASAGNDGPGAGTVSHKGPWLITVAANTHDRDISLGGQTGVANQLIDMSGGLTPPADFDGASRTGGYGPAPIVYAGNFSNGDPNPEQCLHPFPPGTWTNQIVLCDRGAIARVMKCQNVADGGAAGCVLANVTDPAPPLSLYASDAHIIPAIHIDAVDGNALRSWLGSGSGHMATITASSLLTDAAQGDIMADFSSRGPNTFDVLKPDVSNPGSLIYAAVEDGAVDEVGLPPYQGLELNWFSGTSMSSPHTAGSGALLAALHPDWTPLEIKSALMMTADTSLKKENGITDADPWDIGAGRVDLTRASRAGLVLDETNENFLAADPFLGGAPETLNLASLKQSECVTQCTWSRTFTSPVTLSAPTGVGVSWTVSSSSSDGVTVTADPFMVEAGDDATVEFTASASGMNPGDPPGFAEVTLTPNDGSPVLHMPVVIAITTDNFPTDANFVTTKKVDSDDVAGLQYFEAITDLTVVETGLTRANSTDVVLNEDPTNGDPYDNLSQVFFKTVSVPLGSLKLIAVTESDEAPDVDLFVGTGNTPSLATEQCRSTTPTASEICEVTDPAPGTWWILVQNWAGSTSQPDLIELTDGVWPTSDSGNMSVTGPASVPAGQLFDVTVSWDLTGMSLPEAELETELWLGAFSLAKDGGSPPIQTTLVTIDLTLAEIFADGFESGDTSGWDRSVP